MRRSSYIDSIQEVLSAHDIQRDEETLSSLFKVMFDYSTSVLEIFKSIFSHVNLIYQASYSISNQHQQIGKIVSQLREQLMLNETYVSRSTTNIIAVRFREHRDVSKAISQELLALAQDSITNRIITYLTDHKSQKIIQHMRKDFIRSENHLLFLIASHF